MMGDVDLTQLNLLNKLFLGCLLDPLKHHVMSKLYLSGENPDDFVIRNDFVRSQQFEINKSADVRLFLKIMAHADCGFSEEERSVARKILELANIHYHEPFSFSWHHIMKVIDLAKRLFSILPPFIPQDTRLLEKTCEDLRSNLESR